MSTLKALCQYGQSLWLDTIDRHLVQDGGLAQLVKEGSAVSPAIRRSLRRRSPPVHPTILSFGPP